MEFLVNAAVGLPPQALAGGENAAPLVAQPIRPVAREQKGAVEIDITRVDRKSTRLNSSHLVISDAVFCLKKKNLHFSGAGSAPIQLPMFIVEPARLTP